ncbi:MAG: archaemetzincin [Planctomycetota bacterium]|jgi:archaemetzincin
MSGHNLKILGIVTLPLIAGGIILFSAASKTSDEPNRVEKLKETIEKLRPLHTKLGKPKRGDWLHYHREPGQTFEEYLNCEPVVPDEERNVIYVQPLGDFTETQSKIVDLTADFLGRYFNATVKQLHPLPLSTIPPEARRTHPEWGDKQILTSYVLEKVLRPALPKDAFACIALTTSDLWPGEGWNFVFGQASLRQRVGVWSLYRNGDPDAGEEAYRLCLLRTLKTASHELGHMFSMLHCTMYECGMCGSNHREESDRRPIALCPECMAKVCWAAKVEPIERYEKLAEFCQAQGLESETEFYQLAIRALTDQPTTRSTSGPAED